MPSWGLFAACVCTLVYLAARRPLYALVCADLILATFTWEWQLAGVWIDMRDVTLALIALRLAFGSDRPRVLSTRAVPFFYAWVVFGVLASLAYLNAPQNQYYITSPIAAAYQLYRYCWRPIVYYPLAVLLLTDSDARASALAGIVVGADICAASAVLQGYSGVEPVGTLGQKNDLAGVLLVPMILSLFGYFTPGTRRARRFYFWSMLLLARALLISGSHGAFNAAVVAVGLFLAGSYRFPELRRPIYRIAGIALVLLALLFSWDPSLESRPALKYTLDSHSDTFNWRMEERWPHFWQMMLEHPWLGQGTDVDSTLGPAANTPHNGYLSLAVVDGIPAACLFIGFIVLTVRNGARIYFARQPPARRLLGLAIVASVVALMVHNAVDTTITHRLVSTPFWLLAAVAVVESRVTARASAPALEVGRYPGARVASA